MYHVSRRQCNTGVRFLSSAALFFASLLEEITPTVPGLETPPKQSFPCSYSLSEARSATPICLPVPLTLSLSLSGSAHLVLVLAGVAVPRRPRGPVLEHLLVRTTTTIIIIIACGSRREEQQRIAEHAGLDTPILQSVLSASQSLYTFLWGLHRSRVKLHLRPKKMGLKKSICKYPTTAVYAVSLEVVDVVVVVASKLGTQRTYIYM